MPAPTDKNPMPAESSASASLTAPKSGAEPEPTTQEILSKFKQLGAEAKAEEGEDDDEDDEDDEENHAGPSGTNGGNGNVGASGEGKKKKKKKKKGKTSQAVQNLKTLATGNAPQELVDQIRENIADQEPNASDDQIRKALKAMDIMKMLDGQVAVGGKSGTKALGEHKFWKTQPVPQISSIESGGSISIIDEGPIDALKTPAEVKQEPGTLPSGFDWCSIDIKNEEQCKEVYILLSENYVEDDDAMFRFRYSKEFLIWALTAPGYLPDWHVGVRVQKTGKLVAFISGIKVDLRVRHKSFPAAEINFLCVHKKLRSKRLAPVLIKEVTRRVNLQNVWQAIYTAGIVIPTPIGTCRYFHRNLNPPKLVDIGFAHLPRTQTMARMIKQYAVPSEPRIPGFREMEKKDVPAVADLLRKYLSKFEVAQNFDEDEDVEHWFLSGRGKDVGGKRIEQVVWSYVVEDPISHNITDMISFFSLPSSIMKHPKHNVLNAAYLFYYATDAIFQPGGSAEPPAAHEAKTKAKLGVRLNELLVDIMAIAKAAEFDVLNALTLLDNNLFLDEQKFGAGDGFLNYYLYNWRCAPIDGGQQGTKTKQSSSIGMVML